jgi:hypothetical protein
MELHPLPGPWADLDRVIAAGNVRLLQQQPRTVGEILRDASAAMDVADEAEEYARDPVSWLRAHRPRRRLIDILLHGRQK